MKIDKPERAHDILLQTRQNPMRAIFRPHSVALIGASEREHSVGLALARNLSGFDGEVWFVNPLSAEVIGRKTFPSIKDIPSPVELAVIATPAKLVPAIIRECVEAGVTAAIIISAGFKESGGEGCELERQIMESARGKLRIVGPNCLGVMSPHFGLNATFAAHPAERGSVAFISQSGALCTAILDWSLRDRVGFSAFVSIGSMLDVGWGDLIDWLGDDPLTKSILIYMESIGDPRAFLSAAREVAQTKPIIVIKVGRSEAAAKAAASHTGSLTGSDAVLDAAFRRAGVLRVATIGELFNMAEVLAKQPLPRGPRLAIVTNAGGPGALATDLLVSSGGALAPLGEGTMTRLNETLPPQWSHGNPIDVLGDAGPERFAEAVKLATRDETTDGTLVILTPQAMTDAASSARAIVDASRDSTKPLLASWMGGDDVLDGRRMLNGAGIPTFNYPDTAARAFALMWRRTETLRALYETPALVVNANANRAQRNDARVVINEALNAGRTLLSKSECNRILRAYGIPTNEALLATTVDEAVTHARILGFPVVAKLHSATITHKTDVGGVKLDLRDDDAVRRAWKEIQSAVREQDFSGVTLERMIAAGDGYELILGSSQDAQFGPVLLFGAGGQLVEVFKDHVLGLPPLTDTLARRMIEQTRISAALGGVRGRSPVDAVALEQLMVRFSELIIEQPRIKEMDINPLLATPHGLIALDVRIVLHPVAVPDAALPHSVIRPYPLAYVEAIALRDGSRAMVRPIRPEDEPLIVAFHRTLSERSVYYRYFNALKYDERIAHERLVRICYIDYDREMALVIERADAKGNAEIIAVGRLSKLHGVNAAEFSITISDAWQKHGLGTDLLGRLVKIGREEGLARISADILTENSGMQALARKVGFKLKTDYEEGVCRAEMDL